MELQRSQCGAQLKDLGQSAAACLLCCPFGRPSGQILGEFRSQKHGVYQMMDAGEMEIYPQGHEVFGSGFLDGRAEGRLMAE